MNKDVYVSIVWSGWHQIKVTNQGNYINKWTNLIWSGKRGVVCEERRERGEKEKRLTKKEKKKQLIGRELEEKRYTHLKYYDHKETSTCLHIREILSLNNKQLRYMWC